MVKITFDFGHGKSITQAVSDRMFAQVLDAMSGRLNVDPGLTLEEVERAHIERVLSYTTDFKAAADVLGISKKTLWEKRRKHGIEVAREPGQLRPCGAAGVGGTDGVTA